MKASKPAPRQAAQPARPARGQAAPREAAFSLAGEYITLDNLLKIMGAAPSGGAAKAMVAAGEVRVDGAIELRKTCKIRAGQRVEVAVSRILVSGLRSSQHPQPGTPTSP